MNVGAVVSSQPLATIAAGGKLQYSTREDALAHLVRDGVLPASVTDPAGKRFVSETGQIELQTDAKTFKVVTDRSECFVVPSGAALSGHFATVANGPEGSAVIFITALDGKQLTESGHLLILHLTDAQNSNVKFLKNDPTVVEHMGSLPHLLRLGSTALSLPNLGDSAKAWSLDSTGTRIRPIELKKDGAKTVLRLNSGREGAPCLAYELLK